MKTLLLPLAALAAIGTFASPFSTNPTSTRPEPQPAAAPFHCQVPCGVYGDTMRIQMLHEDATTIEKAMQALEGGELVQNQAVRWIMNKEEHAQNIQDRASAYWLAQRIKTPAKDAGEEARAAYHQQLEHLHRITVAAMKCKQTTDVGHVATLRRLAQAFSESYFSEEDLEHLREHHEGGD